MSIYERVKRRPGHMGQRVRARMPRDRPSRVIGTIAVRAQYFLNHADGMGVAPVFFGDRIDPER